MPVLEARRVESREVKHNIVFRSTIDFRQYSYSRPSVYKWSEHGQRPSDGPADALFVHSPKGMKIENPTFVFDQTQRLLKDEVDNLRYEASRRSSLLATS